MYNSAIVADRIKTSAKEKHIQLRDIWNKLGITDNTLTNLRKGSMISADKLALIADFLGVSTDYLLGRSDNPNMTITITQGNPTISRTGELSRVTSGNIGNITINSEDTVSEESKEILEMIESLSAVQKAKVILMIDEMKKDNKNEN